MKVISHKSQIKTIRQSDPEFRLSDGVIVSQRAGFEISQRCPENYKDLIFQCIKHGWIKPVAYMTEKEYILYGLTK